MPGLKDSGNFGFADQIAALRWVKRNAAAYGSEPAELADRRPASRRTARHALPAPSQVQADGLAAAKGAGCETGNVLGCMRGKPTSAVPLTQDFADGLAYGTALLPQHPAAAIKAGRKHPSRERGGRAPVRLLGHHRPRN